MSAKNDEKIFWRYMARKDREGKPYIIEGHTKEEKAVVRHLMRMAASGEYDIEISGPFKDGAA